MYKRWYDNQEFDFENKEISTYIGEYPLYVNPKIGLCYTF